MLPVPGRPTAGPTSQAVRKGFEKVFPRANWFQWEPVHRENARAGIKQAFGQAVREQLHLDKAQIIACFDADPLGRHPNGVRHERDWAKGRRTADQGRMNRVYAAEPSFSRLGTVADERLPVRASQIPQLVAALAAKLGVANVGSANANGSSKFIETLAADLKAHQGESVVLVGEDQPAETHALAWAINQKLGNLGRTVTFIEDPLGDAPHAVDQLKDLVSRIQANKIDTLIILDGNPVYNAPADVEFAEAIKKLGTAIHLSQYVNETSKLCHWHLPQAHYLEAWGDGRAWDGTLSVQQPLILPLFDDGSGNYGGRSPIEVLAPVAGQAQTDGHSLVRQTFQGILPSMDFEKRWRRVLHQGVVKDSAAQGGGADATESGDPPREQ